MKRTLIILFFLSAGHSFGQDISFNRSVVDTLTSRNFWGRGYTNEGMKKAADYLALQLKSFGLKPLGTDYLQPFTYPANTFPGKMELELNGMKLNPGVDFIVGPESRGIKAKGKLVQQDSTHYVDPENRVIISLEEKLTWSVEQKVADYTAIAVNRSILKNQPASYKINIENKFLAKFIASNVSAFVMGTSLPDSFIFITAHYDHLGGMGADTYFPGANDNASGVALLLSLAKYYAAHPQKYSIAFILFAGEEAGLVGSKFFTENPLSPLKNIRFLVNTDLAGTGEEGIMVVNATEFPKEFALMNAINDKYKYLVKIGARGKAANSDHYFFTEKGVPAFFFYTLGGIKAYHDIFDRSATLPLNEQADLFNLLLKFNEGLMGK
jgi:hypothetical protein